MNSKVTGIVSYLTIVGWLVAYVAGDKEDSFAKHHLNQGLVLGVIDLICFVLGKVLGWIPVIGSVVGIILYVIGIALLLVAVYGIVTAVQGSTKSIPVVGDIQLIK